MEQNCSWITDCCNFQMELQKKDRIDIGLDYELRFIRRMLANLAVREAYGSVWIGCPLCGEDFTMCRCERKKKNGN